MKAFSNIWHNPAWLTMTFVILTIVNVALALMVNFGFTVAAAISLIGAVLNLFLPEPVS